MRRYYIVYAVPLILLVRPESLPAVRLAVKQRKGENTWKRGLGREKGLELFGEGGPLRRARRVQAKSFTCLLRPILLSEALKCLAMSGDRRSILHL